MSLPTCPTDCSSNLPIVDFNLCAPDINAGQISRIYFTTPGNPLANWASEAEWDSRLENDAPGSSKIRTLIGIGSLPVPETTEKEISLGRKIFGKRKFSLAFRVDETNDTNHVAVTTLQCATGNYLFWFVTRDGRLFGGSSGILATIKADMDIPEAYDDIITYQFVISWDTKFMPEVIDSPITDATGDQF